jgi:hypothetical protein
MSGLLALVLAAAVSASPPLELSASLERDTLAVQFQLVEPLPEDLEAALPTGAGVGIRYQVRARSTRKMWWDKKLWKGEAVATAVFDPVIGRYRCDLVLDGVIVTSREVDTAEEARLWLVQPPQVRFAMPEEPLKGNLKVRVRAVFSSSTKWLFFPDTEGTRWVEVPVVPPPDADRVDAQPDG